MFTGKWKFFHCNHTTSFCLIISDGLSLHLLKSSVLLLSVVVHRLHEPPQLKANREGGLHKSPAIPFVKGGSSNLLELPFLFSAAFR